MVSRCSVMGCGRKSDYDKTHSFFSLPKNPETCRKWLEFVKVENAHSHIRICTDHFEKRCIKKKYPRPLLVHNAIPTIRVPLVEQNNKESTVQRQSCTNNELLRASQPEIIEPEKVSPSPKQIININVNNVSAIIISSKNEQIIVNINNQEMKTGSAQEKS